jgi:hypothetical protein
VRVLSISRICVSTCTSSLFFLGLYLGLGPLRFLHLKLHLPWPRSSLCACVARADVCCRFIFFRVYQKSWPWT